MKKSPAIDQTQKKTPEDSSVTMTELVLPSNTNALGTIFGGTVMAWIDIAAAIAAARHARRVAVTASIDALHFISPIKLGQVVHIRARVNRAFKTSMEVGVRVEAEDQLTGTRSHCVTAYATFVAVNEKGKPTDVPPIEPQSADDHRRYKAALTRKETRLRLKQELNASDKF